MAFIDTFHTAVKAGSGLFSNDLKRRIRTFLGPDIMQSYYALHREWSVGINSRIEFRKASSWIKQNFDSSPDRPTIYVDCGFNTGWALQKMIVTLPSYVRFYGFDVNEAVLGKYRTRLLSKFPERIASLNFSAVGTHNEGAKFRTGGHSPFKFIDEATTIQPDFETRNQSTEAQSVPSFDFSQWLQDLHSQYANENLKPQIIVKMDIEGSEYPVLERLIAEDTMSLMSMLLVEFHVSAMTGRERHYNHRTDEILEALEKASIPTFQWF